MEVVEVSWLALDTYNAEVARGIVHTEDWKAKMALEQERFDAMKREEARSCHGVITVEGRW